MLRTPFSKPDSRLQQMFYQLTKNIRKGICMSLKDQLILTKDEAYATAARVVEEKKQQAKKPGKWGQKCKVQEEESESEDNSSHLGSDSALSLEILDYMRYASGSNKIYRNWFAVVPRLQLCHDLR
jgi:hypothetical protein